MVSAVGALTSAGRYSIGLSMFAAAIGQARGADSNSIDGFANSALSTDTLKSVLSFFMEEEDIENSGILEALEGNEGPINTILGSLLVLPGDMKQWGVYAGLAWLAYEMYQANKEGKLNKLFGREATEPVQEVSAEAEANLRRAAEDFEQVNATRPDGGADLDAIRAKIRNIIQNDPDIIAQIDDQQLQASPEGMVLVAEADNEELDPDLEIS